MKHVAFARMGFACLGLLVLGSGSRAQDTPPATAAATPASASPAGAEPVPPEISRQLRAIFEPLRKEAEAEAREATSAKNFIDTKTAELLKKLEEPGADFATLEAANNKTIAQAMAKHEKASQALNRKKQEAMKKAGQTGATDAQIQAEWSGWLARVRSGLKP